MGWMEGFLCAGGSEGGLGGRMELGEWYGCGFV